MVRWLNSYMYSARVILFHHSGTDRYDSYMILLHLSICMCLYLMIYGLCVVFCATIKAATYVLVCFKTYLRYQQNLAQKRRSKLQGKVSNIKKNRAEHTAAPGQFITTVCVSSHPVLNSSFYTRRHLYALKHYQRYIFVSVTELASKAKRDKSDQEVIVYPETFLPSHVYCPDIFFKTSFFSTV